MNEHVRRLSIKKHLSPEQVALIAESLSNSSMDKLPVEILDHLEICPTCQNKVFYTSEIIQENDFQVLEEDYLSPENNQTLSRKRFPGLLFLKIAAIIVVLLGFTFLLYFWSGNPGKDNQQVAGKVEPKKEVMQGDSGIKSQESLSGQKVKPPIGDELKVRNNQLASFTSVPHLEMLVGEYTRADSFQVISPSNGFIYKDSLVFQFSSANQTKTIRIINNQDSIIDKFVIKGERGAYFKDLDPGLYYWSLTIDDEVIYVGKFLRK